MCSSRFFWHFFMTFQVFFFFPTLRLFTYTLQCAALMWNRRSQTTRCLLFVNQSKIRKVQFLMVHGIGTWKEFVMNNNFWVIEYRISSWSSFYSLIYNKFYCYVQMEGSSRFINNSLSFILQFLVNVDRRNRKFKLTDGNEASSFKHRMKWKMTVECSLQAFSTAHNKKALELHIFLSLWSHWSIAKLISILWSMLCSYQCCLVSTFWGFKLWNWISFHLIFFFSLFAHFRCQWCSTDRIHPRVFHSLRN